ncbi:MAG TPA: dTDP-4-dehydrorhamnose 3,5-epimerase [Chitinivibrionales bacterium]|nr:dTDP-4-dehydrorhamnose 3,5-epimerase [Chitinivibrionales bacterium]
MKFTETNLKGVWIISPVVHEDGRGFFLESFLASEMEAHGLPGSFVQDNHARSTAAGVIRGLHFQKPPRAQSKLIRVVRGSVFDAVVDLRKNSETFGKWLGFTLSEQNKEMLFVPKGFAHGYCTMAPGTEFLYKVDDYYSPAHDSGIRWNDPGIGIGWPNVSPVISDKDKRLPFLKDIEPPF